MKIPEHVKKNAVDEVYDRETSAAIRAFRDSGVAVSAESLFTRTPPRIAPPPAAARLFAAYAKQKASDAFWDSEISNHIRLVKNGDDLQVPVTPLRDSQRIAGKVADAHKSCENLEAAQKRITQDDFGRE